jgi:hypothetical protein
MGWPTSATWLLIRDGLGKLIFASPQLVRKNFKTGRHEPLSTNTNQHDAAQ